MNVQRALVMVVTVAMGMTATAASVNSTVDGGGRHTTSDNYDMDGSLGWVAGISDSPTPPATLKSGYIGQLTEVASLSVTAAPSSVSEGGTCHLTGIAQLDDATVTALEGSSIIWSAPTYPIATVRLDGVAVTTNVYGDTYGNVTGNYLGVCGSGVILVLNSNPDNFGLYAGDQVPDDWQCRYFGANNPLGKASATNCTGRDNLYTYVADLNPTNPLSRLELTGIEELPIGTRVNWQGGTWARQYLEVRQSLNGASDLWTAVFTNLPPTATATSFTNAGTTNGPQFYRIKAERP